MWVALPARAQGVAARPYWQRQRPQGYIALQQATRDATTDQQALLVASHPDDRYVMPAAYLRFARGWRVDVALMTRGEGGQNSQGPEIGDELGRKRTLETEACAAPLDLRVWYLNRQDAGYCRSGQEALELWGRDTATDLARIIRKVRPDVLLTTHDPDEPHGHDQALLQILPRALALAAGDDASERHAKLRDLAPHRVSKAFRGPSAQESARVRDALPMWNIDPTRGETYRRLAYLALKQHRSQEPIRPIDELFARTVPLFPLEPDRAKRAEDWTLVDGLPSLFDVADPELEKQVDNLEEHLGSSAELVARAIALHQRLRAIQTPSGSDLEIRQQRRLEALERIVLHGSAFRVTADVPPGASAISGQPFEFAIRVHNGGKPIFRNLRIRAAAGGQLSLDNARRQQLTELAAHGPFLVKAHYRAPRGATAHPRWRRELFRRERFVPPVQLRCAVTVVDDRARPLMELEFALDVEADIRPSVELEVIPRAVLLTRERTAQKVIVRATRHTKQPLRGKLEVLYPAGFAVANTPAIVDMVGLDHQDYAFEVRAPRDLEPGVYNLHVRLGEYRTVLPVHKLDVRVPDQLTVGLIEGVNDTTKSVLRAFVGTRLAVLDDQELALANFDTFDTIVVDIRALRPRTEARTWRAARAAFPRLLEFARRGGRLVVFYHKDTEINAASGLQAWPYPIVVGKGRVTREDTPVDMIDPEHLLLRVPNRIQPEDWDGWVQERGLYFPQEYAKQYREVLSTADPGEPQMRGGVLYAQHGKGEYVYCALALYRQLDNFHPGACRVFANLVASRRATAPK